MPDPPVTAPAAPRLAEIAAMTEEWIATGHLAHSAPAQEAREMALVYEHVPWLLALTARLREQLARSARVRCVECFRTHPDHLDGCMIAALLAETAG